MPALDFLVLVFEAVKPVLEPLPVCIDAKRDATWGGEEGVGGGRDEGESSAVTPLAHGRRSQHQRADARGRCWCRLGVLATG